MTKPFYAKDRAVWKRPVNTPQSDGSVSVLMGFCVCEICDHVSDDAADEIANALNAAAQATAAAPGEGKS